MNLLSAHATKSVSSDATKLRLLILTGNKFKITLIIVLTLSELKLKFTVAVEIAIVILIPKSIQVWNNLFILQSYNRCMDDIHGESAK